MMGPEIVMIAAVAEKNLVIGRGQELPWHIPADLQHFKRHTLGKPLVMGRLTFESTIHQFGRPLPGRRNIVLTSRRNLPEYPDIETYASVREVLSALADQEVVYIGGGGAVYEAFLPLADRLELTFVEGDYEGDAFFPEFDHLVGTEFELTNEEQHEGFRFTTYLRMEEEVDD